MKFMQVLLQKLARVTGPRVKTKIFYKFCFINGIIALKILDAYIKPAELFIPRNEWNSETYKVIAAIARTTYVHHEYRFYIYMAALLNEERDFLIFKKGTNSYYFLGGLFIRIIWHLGSGHRFYPIIQENDPRPELGFHDLGATPLAVISRFVFFVNIFLFGYKRIHFDFNRNFYPYKIYRHWVPSKLDGTRFGRNDSHKFFSESFYSNFNMYTRISLLVRALVEFCCFPFVFIFHFLFRSFVWTVILKIGDNFGYIGARLFYELFGPDVTFTYLSSFSFERLYYRKLKKIIYYTLISQGEHVSGVKYKELKKKLKLLKVLRNGRITAFFYRALAYHHKVNMFKLRELQQGLVFTNYFYDSTRVTFEEHYHVLINELFNKTKESFLEEPIVLPWLYDEDRLLPENSFLTRKPRLHVSVAASLLRFQFDLAYPSLINDKSSVFIDRLFSLLDKYLHFVFVGTLQNQWIFRMYLIETTVYCLYLFFFYLQVGLFFVFGPDASLDSPAESKVEIQKEVDNSDAIVLSFFIFVLQTYVIVAKECLHAAYVYVVSISKIIRRKIISLLNVVLSRRPVFIRSTVLIISDLFRPFFQLFRTYFRLNTFYQEFIVIRKTFISTKFEPFYSRFISGDLDENRIALDDSYMDDDTIVDSDFFGYDDDDASITSSADLVGDQLLRVKDLYTDLYADDLMQDPVVTNTTFDQQIEHDFFSNDRHNKEAGLFTVLFFLYFNKTIYGLAPHKLPAYQRVSDTDNPDAWFEREAYWGDADFFQKREQFSSLGITAESADLLKDWSDAYTKKLKKWHNLQLSTRYSRIPDFLRNTPGLSAHKKFTNSDWLELTVFVDKLIRKPGESKFKFQHSVYRTKRYFDNVWERFSDHLKDDPEVLLRTLANTKDLPAIFAHRFLFLNPGIAVETTRIFDVFFKFLYGPRFKATTIYRKFYFTFYRANALIGDIRGQFVIDTPLLSLVQLYFNGFISANNFLANYNFFYKTTADTIAVFSYLQFLSSVDFNAFREKFSTIESSDFGQLFIFIFQYADKPYVKSFVSTGDEPLTVDRIKFSMYIPRILNLFTWDKHVYYDKHVLKLRKVLQTRTGIIIQRFVILFKKYPQTRSILKELTTFYTFSNRRITGVLRGDPDLYRMGKLGLRYDTKFISPVTRNFFYGWSEHWKPFSSIADLVIDPYIINLYLPAQFVQLHFDYFLDDETEEFIDLNDEYFEPYDYIWDTVSNEDPDYAFNELGGYDEDSDDLQSVLPDTGDYTEHDDLVTNSDLADYEDGPVSLADYTDDENEFSEEEKFEHTFLPYRGDLFNYSASKDLNQDDEFNLDEFDLFEDASVPLARLFVGGLRIKGVVPATDPRIFLGPFDQAFVDTSLHYKQNFRKALKNIESTSLAIARSQIPNVDNINLRQNFYRRMCGVLLRLIVYIYLTVQYTVYISIFSDLQARPDIMKAELHFLVISHYRRWSHVYGSKYYFTKFSASLSHWLRDYELIRRRNRRKIFFSIFRTYGVFRIPEKLAQTKPYARFLKSFPFSQFFYASSNYFDRIEDPTFIASDDPDYYTDTFDTKWDLVERKRFIELDELSFTNRSGPMAAEFFPDGFLSSEEYGRSLTESIGYDAGKLFSYAFEDDYLTHVNELESKLKIFFIAIRDLFDLVRDYTHYGTSLFLRVYLFTPFAHWVVFSDKFWLRLSFRFGFWVNILRYFIKFAIYITFVSYFLLVIPYVTYYFLAEYFSTSALIVLIAIFTLAIILAPTLLIFNGAYNFNKNLTSMERTAIFTFGLYISIHSNLYGYSRTGIHPSLIASTYRTPNAIRVKRELNYDSPRIGGAMRKWLSKGRRNYEASGVLITFVDAHNLVGNNLRKRSKLHKRYIRQEPFKADLKLKRVEKPFFKWTNPVYSYYFIKNNVLNMKARAFTGYKYYGRGKRKNGKSRRLLRREWYRDVHHPERTGYSGTPRESISIARKQIRDRCASYYDSHRFIFRSGRKVAYRNKRKATQLSRANYFRSPRRRHLFRKRRQPGWTPYPYDVRVKSFDHMGYNDYLRNKQFFQKPNLTYNRHGYTPRRENYVVYRVRPEFPEDNERYNRITYDFYGYGYANHKNKLLFLAYGQQTGGNPADPFVEKAQYYRFLQQRAQDHYFNLFYAKYLRNYLLYYNTPASGFFTDAYGFTKAHATLAASNIDLTYYPASISGHPKNTAYNSKDPRAKLPKSKYLINDRRTRLEQVLNHYKKIHNPYWRGKRAKRKRKHKLKHRKRGIPKTQRLFTFPMQELKTKVMSQAHTPRGRELVPAHRREHYLEIAKALRTVRSYERFAKLQRHMGLQSYLGELITGSPYPARVIATYLDFQKYKAPVIERPNFEPVVDPVYWKLKNDDPARKFAVNAYPSKTKVWSPNFEYEFFRSPEEIYGEDAEFLYSDLEDQRHKNYIIGGRYYNFYNRPEIYGYTDELRHKFSTTTNLKDPFIRKVLKHERSLDRVLHFTNMRYVKDSGIISKLITRKTTRRIFLRLWRFEERPFDLVDHLESTVRTYTYIKLKRKQFRKSMFSGPHLHSAGGKRRRKHRARRRKHRWLKRMLLFALMDDFNHAQATPERRNPLFRPVVYNRKQFLSYFERSRKNKRSNNSYRIFNRLRSVIMRLRTDPAHYTSKKKSIAPKINSLKPHVARRTGYVRKYAGERGGGTNATPRSVAQWSNSLQQRNGTYIMYYGYDAVTKNLSRVKPRYTTPGDVQNKKRMEPEIMYSATLDTALAIEKRRLEILARRKQQIRPVNSPTHKKFDLKNGFD